MPYIRIGGSSADYTNYSATQVGSLVRNGDDAAYRYTIGPAYLDRYKVSGTKISQDLNFASLLGEDATVAQSSLVAWSKAACALLGPYLNVLELGNEPESYIQQHRNTSSFTGAIYATKWKAAAKSITDACPAFKTAGFMGPSAAQPVGEWIVDAFTAGLDSTNNVTQVSIHS
jgi:hypothetical protein